MKSVMHPAEKSAYQSVSLKIIIVNGRDAIQTILTVWIRLATICSQPTNWKRCKGG